MFRRKPEDSEKSRFFWAELYPDSAPEGWLDDFRMLGKAFSVSPLHDKDKFEDGSPKKAHYHIIIDWGNTTTYRTIRKIWESYNQPYPLIINDPYAVYKYHCHLDDPQKYQYDVQDIRNFNKFDPAAYMELTKSEIDLIMDKIENYIFDYRVTEFIDLVCRFRGDKDFKRVIRTHTWYFKNLCDGLRYKLASEEMNIPID